MNVDLDEDWQKKLAKMPETGMGYQLVDVVLRGGRVLRELMVFNGQACQTDESFRSADVVDVRLHRGL